MTWLVATVAPRREANVVSELQAFGMDAYCPMQARKQTIGARNSNRWRRVVSPIVPGYAFVQVETPQQLADAQGVEGLIDFLRIWRTLDGRPAHVPYEVRNSEWIWQMRAQEQAGEFDRTIDRSPQLRMKAGERVRIVAGAFQGMLATIKNVTKREFKLEVDAVGPLRGVKVSMGKMDVEAA